MRIFSDCDVDNIGIHDKKSKNYTISYRSEYNNSWIHGKKYCVSRNMNKEVKFPEINGRPFKNSWLWAVSEIIINS